MGLGYRGLSLGFKVQGSGFKVAKLQGFRDSTGVRVNVQCPGFRVQGSGFRI